MKMETTITATEDATIKQIVLKTGKMLNSEDLVIKLIIKNSYIKKPA